MDNFDDQSQKPLNEESGSALLTGAYLVAGLSGITAAFNIASAGHIVAGLAVGAVGIAMGATGVLSSFFTQKENYASVTTCFGQKKGNITGGGIKFKRPWPFRSVYEKVPVFTQNVQCVLENMQTYDDVTAKTVTFNTLYRVVDPATYAFSAADRIEQMQEIVANSMKAQIGKSVAIRKDLDDEAITTSGLYDLKSDRVRIAEQIKKDVNDRLRTEYGLEVVDVPMEAVLDERFTEAVANRVLAEQEGLAERVHKTARGQGIAGEREAVLEGLAESAQKLVKDGIVQNLPEALNFVRFIIDKEAQQNTKGVIILNAAGNDGKSQADFMAAVVGANNAASALAAEPSGSAAPVATPAHPADAIMDEAKTAKRTRRPRKGAEPT